MNWTRRSSLLALRSSEMVIACVKVTTCSSPSFLAEGEDALGLDPPLLKGDLSVLLPAAPPTCVSAAAEAAFVFALLPVLQFSMYPPLEG